MFKSFTHPANRELPSSKSTLAIIFNSNLFSVLCILIIFSCYGSSVICWYHYHNQPSPISKYCSFLRKFEWSILRDALWHSIMHIMPVQRSKQGKYYMRLLRGTFRPFHLCSLHSKPYPLPLLPRLYLLNMRWERKMQLFYWPLLLIRWLKKYLLFVY